MGLAEMFSIVLVSVTIAYFLSLTVLSFPLFRKPPEQKMPKSDLPFVSVIVAARNELGNIPACLEGIIRQDYPRDRFEIIVSDDLSEDDTRVVAEQFLGQHPGIRGKVLGASGERPLPGKKAALMRAIREAKGEWVLTTDADTRRGSGWITALVMESQRTGRKMILGPVSLEGGKGFFAAIQSLEFLGIMGVTGGSAALGIPVMCNGANLFYLKNAFEEAGGFTTRTGFASGDDQFLLSAIRKKYGKHAVSFARDPRAIVSTLPQPGLSSFLNQRLRWVSKSKGYTDPAVLLAGSITYLVHLLVVAGLVSGIWTHTILVLTIVCWVLKMIADLQAVVPMALFFKRRKLLWLFLPGQVFQAVYVVIAGFLGLILPYRWKGRLIRA